MPESEPTNLVLEQLRLMRGENANRFDKLESDIAGVRTDLGNDIDGVKKEVRGLKLQTIAELYKANLTVASFAELDTRLKAVERKVFT